MTMKELYERLDALRAAAGIYEEEFVCLIEQLAAAHRGADDDTWRTVRSWLNRHHGA